MTPPASDDTVDPALAALRERAAALAVAHSAARIPYWDERVGLPADAGSWRERQRAWLVEAAHAEVVSDATREVVAAAEAALGDHPEVVAMRRDLDRAAAMPAPLVGALAAATARARAAWSEAREADDASIFAPHLEELLVLARDVADVRSGGVGDRYDALLDSWEPGMTGDAVECAFDPLAAGLSALIADLGVPEGRGAGDDQSGAGNGPLQRVLDPEAKRRFEHRVLAAIGFEHDAGRIDPSPRAFCIWLGPRDVRMTTRFHNLPGLGAFNSTMHEAGHAIYGQGLARTGVPMTLADAAGVALDESQSRLYENQLGMSDAFWEYCHGVLDEECPGVFDDVAPDVLATLARTPRRSPQRVGADELTYNLHVVLRFRLERALIAGDLAVPDLPAAWRDGMRELLGIDVTSDRAGCLQDVHWSIGQFGYFPCYALGNMYAAQVWSAAMDALSGFVDDVRRGEMLALRDWLDANIYRHGRGKTTAEIIGAITGGDGQPDPAPLLDYLAARYGAARVTSA